VESQLYFRRYYPIGVTNPFARELEGDVGPPAELDLAGPSQDLVPAWTIQRGCHDSRHS
jgi:hypothetical protein